MMQKKGITYAESDDDNRKLNEAISILCKLQFGLINIVILLYNIIGRLS